MADNKIIEKYTCSRCGHSTSEFKGTCPSCGAYLYIKYKTPQEIEQENRDKQQIYLWIGIIGIFIGVIGLGLIGTENGSFVLCLPLGILFLVGALKTSK
jgi:ribosomal protein L37E